MDNFLFKYKQHQVNIMVDYLGDKRAFPKMKSPSADEIAADIKNKKCKTCTYYTFYYCTKLQQQCGPEGSCLQSSTYQSKIDSAA